MMVSNANHGAPATTAAARVATFCDSHDDWEGEQDYITSTGTYRSQDAVKLSKADLRELVADNAALTATVEFYRKLKRRNII